MLYAVLLGGPFFVALLVAKAVKVGALLETGIVTGVIASVHQDLFLAVFCLPVLAVFLEKLLPKRKERLGKVALVLLVFLHVIFTLMTFAVVIEHAFFLVTGAVLDYYIFSVSLHNAG